MTNNFAVVISAVVKRVDCSIDPEPTAPEPSDCLLFKDMHCYFI